MAGDIQVLLPLGTGDVGNASFDICQLRYSDEAVPRHGFLSPQMGRPRFATVKRFAVTAAWTDRGRIAAAIFSKVKAETGVMR